LDEPLANLDAKLRNTARDDLKRFQRQIQTTTVYVTHDQVEAMGLGDRIVVMERGKVRQIGTPQEVYEDPVDTFVATFVGQPPMNLLDTGDPALPPRTLTGFRPEHFLPKSVFGTAEELRTFRFAVRRVEYLGSDRYVYGSVAGAARRCDHHREAAGDHRARHPGRRDPRVRRAPACAALLRPETGLRRKG